MKEKTKKLADSVGAVYPLLFFGRHDGVLLFAEEIEEAVADLGCGHGSLRRKGRRRCVKGLRE